MKIYQKKIRQFSSLIPTFLPILIILGLILPRSIMAVAVKVGYEMHLVSFIIGPATYSLGEQLVPGIDYLTQYSVGLPYLFSWIMGTNSDNTVLNYMRLMIGAMVFFYIVLFYCLRWLMSSWKWGLSTTVVILLLQFHVDRTFFDPSSYVLRYPLLIITIWATSLWIAKDFSIKSTLFLVASIGGSLFLNTETGVYQAIAVTFVGFVNSRGRFCNLIYALLPSLGGLTFLIFICLAAFGENVLTRQFFDGLVLPFFIYGGGFGGVSIDWQFGWHILYNMVAPGFAIVTIILISRLLWQNNLSEQRRAQLSTVMMFSIIGILMSAKYINMSLVALWHVNAIGFLTIISWWGRQFQLILQSEKAISKRSFYSWTPSTLVITTLCIFSIGLLTFANDLRNPTFYGLRAWAQYPALLNPKTWRKQTGCIEFSCSAPRISELDIDLINRWSQPGERIAILGWNDWAYLIHARRASWFHFLPSTALFTHHLLNMAKTPPKIVFLPRPFDKNQISSIHPELAVLWSTTLTEYDIQDSSPNLTVWIKR